MKIWIRAMDTNVLDELGWEGVCVGSNGILSSINGICLLIHVFFGEIWCLSSYKCKKN